VLGVGTAYEYQISPNLFPGKVTVALSAIVSPVDPEPSKFVSAVKVPLTPRDSPYLSVFFNLVCNFVAAVSASSTGVAISYFSAC
jgi:hypothetical protein